MNLFNVRCVSISMIASIFIEMTIAPIYINTEVTNGGGFLGTQDFFFAHFTTFASAFFTVIFSNCLTIGYASFDAKKKKKIKSTLSFSR